MPSSRIRCPNGCQEELEREDHGGFTTIGDYIPPSAEYVCPECGWDAIWQKDIPGLRILFPGKNAPWTLTPDC